MMYWGKIFLQNILCVADNYLYWGFFHTQKKNNMHKSNFVVAAVSKVVYHTIFILTKILGKQ